MPVYIYLGLVMKLHCACGGLSRFAGHYRRAELLCYIGFLLLFSSSSAVFLLLSLLREVNFCPDFVLCNVVNLARHQRALIKCPTALIKRFCLEAALSKTERNIVYAVAKHIVCKTFSENLVKRD